MYTTGRVRGRVHARVHEHLQSRVRAVYMARVYGCVLALYTAVYMARTRPCNGGVHCTRMRVYTAVYTAVNGPCTRPRTGRVGPCTCRVQGRGPCTVYTARAQCVTTIFFAKDTFYAETHS